MAEYGKKQLTKVELYYTVVPIEENVQDCIYCPLYQCHAHNKGMCSVTGYVTRGTTREARARETLPLC